MSERAEALRGLLRRVIAGRAAKRDQTVEVTLSRRSGALPPLVEVTLTHNPDWELPWQARVTTVGAPLVTVAVESEADARRIMGVAVDQVWRGEPVEIVWKRAEP